MRVYPFMKFCLYHLCENEIPDKASRKFCCRSCQNKYYVDRRRLEIKIKAIAYKGGECQSCGFKGAISCFDFHHLDPSTKSFSISDKPHTRSWERTKKELDKCDLLCANCHRKEEFYKTAQLKTFLPDLMAKYGL